MQVTNPTGIPLHIGLRSESDGLFKLLPGDEDIVIAPGETATVRLAYSPPEKGKRHAGVINLVNLDMKPGQSKPDLLGKLFVEGTGGEYSIRVNTAGGAGSEGVDLMSEPEVAEASAVLDGEDGEKVMPTIQVKFSKVVRGQKAKKFFEIENCGDTVVDLHVMDHNGNIIEGEGLDIPATVVNYRVEPVKVSIGPKTKQKFAVFVKGVADGEGEFQIQLQTATLIDTKCIPVAIFTTVISPDSLLQDSVKAFARSDTSIEETLDMFLQEERNFDSERNLWKVLLPVIRIKSGLPSQELSYVPPQEPKTDIEDLGPYTLRPPAIPKDVFDRNKRWYHNRVSMGLEGYQNRQLLASREGQRRMDALEFVKPLEKQVYLERKGYVKR
ncbi:hypothetical protein HDV05_007785 [Chytridiales sp. JEL 0842]|nr:hypothetical protein HDV05_007785 [Chytridiales sp. JEL 0842]